MGSGNGEVDPTSRIRTGSQMVGKLSMKDWDVDPLRVMKHLFNKEFTADEHSGLVSGPRGGTPEGPMQPPGDHQH